MPCGYNRCPPWLGSSKGAALLNGLMNWIGGWREHKQLLRPAVKTTVAACLSSAIVANFGPAEEFLGCGRLSSLADATAALMMPSWGDLANRVQDLASLAAKAAWWSRTPTT